MKNTLLFLLMSFPIFTGAQYYYKDLVANKEINTLLKTYIDNNIHTVTGTGRTPAGIQPQDYREVHEMNMDRKELKIITTIDNKPDFLIYHFDAAGKVESTLDSSAGQKNFSLFQALVDIK